MTSLGRGRGWASAESKNSALRRPGTVPPQTFDFTNLINRINQIEQDENPKQFSHDARIIFNNMDDEDIKNVMNKLYVYALNDRKFGQRLARLIKTTIRLNVDKQENYLSFRYYILSDLQNDYTRRTELKEENMERLRNSMFLLFEVDHYMGKYVTGHACSKIFDPALIDYMTMFVESAGVEELEVIAEQMTKYGKEMYKRQAVALDKLMIDVRKTLIAGNLSSSSRAILLYLLDLAALKYELPSKELREFYAKELGSSSFILGENNTGK